MTTWNDDSTVHVNKPPSSPDRPLRVSKCYHDGWFWECIACWKFQSAATWELAMRGARMHWHHFHTIALGEDCNGECR